MHHYLPLKVLSFFVFLVFVVTASYSAEASPESICDPTCTKMRLFFGQKNVVRVIVIGKNISNGSGVLIKEGILTNNHVIEGAIKIYVEFYGIRGYREVTVIGRNPAADLALLTAPILPEGVSPISLGDALRVGDRVYTIGYPFGVRSITVGNVNASESVSWLYAITQAPLAPGSSGGPILNEDGKISGVNTAIVSIPGVLMSFALSVEHVKLILPRLSRERIVRNGALGFSFIDATSVFPIHIESIGLSYPPNDGVMVIVVPPSSPPDLAGIRPGDYVTKFNRISVKNAQDLEKIIFFDYRPDEEIEIELKRGGQKFIKKFLLSEYVSPLQNKGNRD